ncbi:MAG: rRNA (adenine2503-C2)-methyltransferase [Bacteroidales bacterium]|jgi:23S rRNA (adenine2503-C2)-methyltransferase|nr:rRNA (adenine2503-C2)-methyltransferase [Bacteroidales bacterium]
MKIPDSKIPLAGANIRDIAKTFKLAGFDSYDPARILLHYYRHKNADIDAIDCYPKKLRQLLKEVYSTDLLQPLFHEKSSDGTEKWLFRTTEGYPFETAWIPDQNRQTICLSTQSGCKFGCKFCMTGSLGFQAQLSAFEILSQLLAIDKPITHVVFMGMGEPLDNYDILSHVIEILTAHWGFSLAARYITVSTVGVLPTLERLGQELTCNIAISLHSPFPDQRAEIIPAERRYPIKDIIAVLEKVEFKRKRRLSFEYLLINGYNDSKEHAAALGSLISHLPAHVNLIPYNYIPGKPYKTTSLKDAETFRQELNKYGLRVTIRKSRGYDISAACGMMAGRSASTHQ